MKTKILIPTEVEITVIRIDVPVDYDDEEMPNDFPGRTDDRWKVDVEIDTGRILNWPAGRTHNLHLTVRDGGTYTLLDATGRLLASAPTTTCRTASFLVTSATRSSWRLAPTA
jgi:hypothetical protein